MTRSLKQLGSRVNVIPWIYLFGLTCRLLDYLSSQCVYYQIWWQREAFLCSLKGQKIVTFPYLALCWGLIRGCIITFTIEALLASWGL